MGSAYELVSTYGTGNAALTTLPHVWDPLSVQAVRANPDSPPACIMSIWAFCSAAADITIHSPRMHDDIQAVHFRVQPTTADVLALEGFQQVVYSQDLLLLTSTYAAAPASAVAENVEYLVYYPNLGGAQQRLVTWAEVEPLVQSYLGIKVIPSTGATAGTFGAPALLNSTEDFSKANSWYAVIGYEVSVAATSIAIQGPDTSNYLYGGPAQLSAVNTRRWFWLLDRYNGVPSIPVINSANKASTGIYACGTTAGTAIPVTLICAYLGPVINNPTFGQ